jgi:DNA polymerase III gamma/tau subunit
MFEQITGHKKQIELLSKAIGRGKLAHAYVFAGPEGVGKRTLAKELAKELLGVKTPPLSASIEALQADISPKGEEKNEENYFHPDYLEVAGVDGIKIEQIRELAYKLSLKPYQAKNKVALIDNADQMSTEAANALLKVLEEPKAYNFIFLITSNANRLPKTILSRCQKITFGPLALSERQSLNIGLSEEAIEIQNRVDEYFQIFMSEKLADRLVTAYDIADLETPEIKNVLETWIRKLELLLLENPTTSLARKIVQLSASRRYLEQNVNSKLLMTNLMLNT